MKNLPYKLLILLSTFISSCQDEDSQPQKPRLTGKWKAAYFKEALYSLPDMTPFPGNTSEPYLYQNDATIEFRSDNVLAFTYKDTSGSSGPVYWTSSCNYTLSGNKIILSNFNPNEGYFRTNFLYIDSLTTNRLVFRDSTVLKDFGQLKVRIITATK
ncbi:lipocalin family protein [Adhaeribacter sp. BT258]|uniref:Lipocalin family protein n=1 Tax=Adhaeribacter terrigena TaxID=2793070 RepID=A0ABS1C140_9BACT|nr:lipocalin family protein [Adhaeribacter terrigena]MBK0403050.1 lipocalin family protein [Adhaeribacter terrigena]